MSYMDKQPSRMQGQLNFPKSDEWAGRMGFI